MNRFVLGLVFCMASVLATYAHARTWTDIHGNMLNGSYKGFNRNTGMVTITQNGRRIPVPFSGLCRDDRDFVIEELKKKGREGDAERYDTEIPEVTSPQDSFNRGPNASGPAGTPAPGVPPGVPGIAGAVDARGAMPNFPGGPGAGVPIPGGNFPSAGHFPGQPGMPSAGTMPRGPAYGVPMGGPGMGMMKSDEFHNRSMAEISSKMERQRREQQEWHQASTQQSQELRDQLAASRAQTMAQNEARSQQHREFREAVKGLSTFEHQLVCEGCKTVFDKEKFKSGDLCPHCNPPSAQAHAAPAYNYTSTAAVNSSSDYSSSSSSNSGGVNRSQSRAIGRIITLVIAAVGGLIGVIRRMGE